MSLTSKKSDEPTNYCIDSPLNIFGLPFTSRSILDELVTNQYFYPTSYVTHQILLPTEYFQAMTNQWSPFQVMTNQWVFLGDDQPVKSFSGDDQLMRLFSSHDRPVVLFP